VTLLALLGAIGGGALLALALLPLLIPSDNPLTRVLDDEHFHVWLLPAFGAICLVLAFVVFDRNRALFAARSAERTFRNLYDSIGDGVFRSTLDGRMISANPALVRLNGYVTEEELIRNCNDIATEWYVDPNRRAEIHQMLLAKGRVNGVVSEVYRHKNRQRIWIEENVRLVRDERTGEPHHYEGTVRDVTETMRRLELQDRYSKIASIMSGCLLQLRGRPDGTFCMPYVSIGLYHMFGIRPEQVAEDSTIFRNLIHRDDYKRVEQAIMHSHATLTPFQQEYRLRLPDGTKKWVLAHSVPEREADGSTLWHGYMVDISDKKRSEAKVYELAYFDALTHLPNRIQLRDRLQRALGQGGESKGALLFVDLDHFKVLNDTKGHHVGDLLLCEVAKRICGCLGSHNLVARLGGDEFVVLLTGLSASMQEAEADVRILGHKLLACIDQPFSFGEDTFQTTASIGAVLLSEADHDVEEVLKRADLAMYEAKRAGRGMLRFFEEKMQSEAADQLALTSELRRAPKEGQLMLYYQPIVEGPGRCIGAESLLRWNHPARGLVSAGEFIALAERSGFMGSIDTWVLKAACATLKEWEADPLTRDLQLSVNVSAQELNRMEFVKVVEDALAQSGARPDRLTLELTEHVMLDDFRAVNAVMQRLQALGLHFALDDFGTGYSSLSYLKRLPIDALKIDQSFVRDIETNESDREIVQTILHIARSLKVSVIAEGVETELQAMLLKQFGCRTYQGYLFGRPMPEEAFRQFLADAATEQSENGDRRRRSA
jgi:diguanylate cyclase (GGDEF)-like protein/PAS domain S-box-containing protein